jgi:hypothetical protein
MTEPSGASQGIPHRDRTATTLNKVILASGGIFVTPWSRCPEANPHFSTDRLNTFGPENPH